MSETMWGPQGLPWQRRGELGLVPAAVATVKTVLLESDKAFGALDEEAGLGEPLLFAVPLATLGGWVGLLWSLLSQGAMKMKDMPGLDQGVYLGILGATAVLLPVLVTLGFFVISGITHVCLGLVGGANKGFGVTFQVMTYTQGSVSVLQVVPFFGSMVASVWGLVVNVQGLSRAHGISTGKAAAAVLLPVMVCCVCLGVAGAMGFAGLMSYLQSSGKL